eukprot:271664-Alexandrium_andersonii.AAC.1
MHTTHARARAQARIRTRANAHASNKGQGRRFDSRASYHKQLAASKGHRPAPMVAQAHVTRTRRHVAHASHAPRTGTDAHAMPNEP